MSESRRRALVVGINTYENSKISSLSQCVNDAESIKNMLEMKEYGFDAKIKTDKNATRREIKKGLNWLFDSQTDFALFYFAGHGIVNDLGTHIVTFDGDEIDFGIELSTIDLYLRKRMRGDANAVVILDCCHSGGMPLKRGKRDFTRSIASEDIRSEISQMRNGHAVLAACGPNEGAAELPSLDTMVSSHITSYRHSMGMLRMSRALLPLA